MRILLVSTARHFGGTERWASLLVRTLSQRHEVHVACHEAIAERLAPRDRVVPVAARSPADLGAFRRLARFAQEREIDLLLPVSRRAYLAASIIARIQGRACVLRLGIVRRPWRPVWDWMVYGWLPHGIIVNAAEIARGLRPIPLRRAAIRVIRNGVDPLPIAATRAGDRFVIVSAGTLSWRKGFYHLIRAVSLLPGNLRQRVDLVIVGGGAAQARLAWLARHLGVAAQVTFTGFLEKPADTVAACDLFALMSSREGISNALLEAMSAGRPVLATLAGGHSEFLENGVNGYVVPTRRPAAVARAIAAIMLDERRAEVGLAGAATVRHLFTTERMAAETEAFLADAVSAARGRPTRDALPPA